MTHAIRMRRLTWACLALTSGAAALIYEILWMRRLGDWLGNAVLATQLVLALFFGGMALGAAWSGRWVHRVDALRRYVQLEALMAAFGLLSPWILNFLGNFYIATASGAAPGLRLVLSVAVTLVFLFVPTLCMGATLPLLVSLARCDDESADILTSRIYLWNTLGAALGAMAGGMLLPHWLGVQGGIWYAASCNGFVAWVAWRHRAALIDTHMPPTPDIPDVPVLDAAKASPSKVSTAPVSVAMWCLFVLSGFCAIGYEVVWARILLATLGNSIYSFSAMLSVYLLGLAVGASVWRFVRQWGGSFGVLQALLGCLGLGTLWVLQELPALEQRLQGLWTPGPASGLAVEWVLICASLLLPAICIGMLFPAMVAAISPASVAPDRGAMLAGRRVAQIAAATTLGGILAPLFVGLWWMPQVGARSALWGLGACNLVLGCLAFALAARWQRGGVVALLVGGALLVLAPAKATLPPLASGERPIYQQEGLAASISIVEDRAGRRRIKINGRFSMGGVAGLFGERRQGHLPRLLVPKARKILVLGVGTGHTLAAIAAHPYDRIDAIELIPGVLSALPFFAATNLGIATQQGVHLVADDARHFLATTPRRYDLIVGDLFHSYKAGVGGLYTTTHFRRGRRHLRKGGAFWQWLPLHQLTPEALRVLVRTYLDVFPHVQGFLAYLNAQTPALGLLGSVHAFHRSPEALGLALQSASPALRKRLLGVDLGTPLAVLSMHIADRQGLDRFARGANHNTEDRPWIELMMPLARWSPGWSQLGARNLQELLSWPLSASWLASLPGALQGPVARRQRGVRSYLKSRIAARAGRPQQALGLLLQAAKLDPSWDLPRKLLANQASVLIRRKAYDAARAFLEKVTLALPTDGEAWALLGNIAYLQQKPQEALRLYQRALQGASRPWLALRNLVVLLERQGRTKEAARWLLGATSRRSEKSFGRLAQKIAVRLAAQKEWRWLRRLGQMICGLTPVPRNGHQLLAFAHLQLQEGALALPLLAKAIQRQPDAERLYLWRLQAHLQAGDLAAAWRVWHQGAARFVGSKVWSRLEQNLKSLGGPPSSTLPAQPQKDPKHKK